MSSISNAVKLTVIAILICLGLVSYMVYYFTVGYDVRRRENRERFLNGPIPYHITSDLCSKGAIPESISDCLGEEIRIKREQDYEVFDYNLSKFATYSDVQTVFGPYQVFCTQPENDKYYCLYQLEASPGVTIVFNNNTNNIVEWY